MSTESDLDFSKEVASTQRLVTSLEQLSTAVHAVDKTSLKTLTSELTALSKNSAMSELAASTHTSAQAMAKSLQTSLNQMKAMLNDSKSGLTVNMRVDAFKTDLAVIKSSFAASSAELVKLEEARIAKMVSLREAETAAKAVAARVEVEQKLLVEAEKTAAVLEANAAQAAANAKALSGMMSNIIARRKMGKEADAEEISALKTHFAGVKTLREMEANAAFQKMTADGQATRTARVAQLLALGELKTLVPIAQKYGGDSTVAALESEKFKEAAVVARAAEVRIALEEKAAATRLANGMAQEARYKEALKASETEGSVTRLQRLALQNEAAAFLFKEGGANELRIKKMYGDAITAEELKQRAANLSRLAVGMDMSMWASNLLAQDQAKASHDVKMVSHELKYNAAIQAADSEAAATRLMRLSEFYTAYAAKAKMGDAELLAIQAKFGKSTTALDLEMRATDLAGAGLAMRSRVSLSQYQEEQNAKAAIQTAAHAKFLLANDKLDFAIAQAATANDAKKLAHMSANFANEAALLNANGAAALEIHKRWGDAITAADLQAMAARAGKAGTTLTTNLQAAEIRAKELEDARLHAVKMVAVIEESNRLTTSKALEGLFKQHQAIETYMQTAGATELEAIAKFGKAAVEQIKLNSSAEIRAIIEAREAAVAASKLGIAQIPVLGSNLAVTGTRQIGSVIAPKDIAATKELSAATVSLTGHNKVLNDGLRGLVQSLGMYSSTMAAIVPMMAGMAIGSGMKHMFDQGRDLEYQMVFVAKLTEGATISVEQFSKAMIGSQLSTKEGAEGLRALAQAGLSSEDALMALPSVMNLAVVGEMKLGAAALVATGLMHAFNLQMTDMPRIIDVMTKAAAISNTSVEGMATAIKTASVVADQFGVKLEEISAGLVVMAKRNIDGTAAGTAMKNFITNLASTTPVAEARMKQLGIEVYNASGQLKSMPEILKIVSDSLVGLSEKTKNEALKDLFNERGRRAAAAMIEDLQLYGETLDILTQKAAGFAASVTRALDHTITGQMKEISNSFALSMDKAFGETADSYSNLLAKLSVGVKSEGLREFVLELSNAAVALTRNIDVVAELVAGVFALRAVWPLASAAVTAWAATATAAIIGTDVAIKAATVSTTALGVALSRVLWPLAILAAAYIAYKLLAGSVDVVREASERRNRESADTVAKLGQEIARMDEETAAIHLQIQENISLEAAIRKVKAAKGELAAVSLDDKVLETRTALDALLAKSSYTREEAAELGKLRTAWQTAVQAKADYVKNRPLEVEQEELANVRNDAIEAAKSVNKLSQELRLKSKDLFDYANKPGVSTETVAKIVEAREKIDSVVKSAINLSKSFEGVKVSDGLRKLPGQMAVLAMETKNAKDEADKLLKTLPKPENPRFAGKKDKTPAVVAVQSETTNIVAEMAKRDKLIITADKEAIANQKSIYDAAFAAKLMTASEYSAKVVDMEAAATANLVQDERDQQIARALAYTEANAKVLETQATFNAANAKNETAKVDNAKKVAVELSNATNVYVTAQLASAASIASAEEKARTASIVAETKYQGELVAIRKQGTDFAVSEAENLAKRTRATNTEDKLRWATPRAAAIISAEAAELDRMTAAAGKNDVQIQELTDSIATYESAVQVASEAMVTAHNNEIEKLRALLELRNQLAGKMPEAVDAAKAAAAIKFDKDEFKKTFDVISDGLVDALMKGGKEGSASLRKLLENELVRKPFVMMVQALIQPIASGLTNMAMGAVGKATGMDLLSGASSASSIYSMGSKAYGWLTGAGAELGGAAANFTASLGAATAATTEAATAIGTGMFGVEAAAVDLTASFVATAAPVAELGAAAAVTEGGFMAAGQSMLAAVPVWGWAIAGLALLAGSGVFDGKGGPKTESAYGLYTDDLPGDRSATGMAGKYVKGIEDSWTALTEKLGIMTDKITVGAQVGIDTIGDSLTQLRVFAEVNGQGVYSRQDRVGNIENVGRTEEELQKAMADEVTVVLFKALQSSSVSNEIKTYLQTVDASLAGMLKADGAANYADQINAMAGALDNVLVISNFQAALESMPFEELTGLSFNAAKGLIEAAGGLDKLSANMSGFYTNFYSATEQQALSVKNIGQAFTDLGLVMPAVDENLKDSYRTMVEGLMAAEKADPSKANAKALAGALALQSGVNSLADGFTSAADAAAAAAEKLAQAIAESVSSAQDLQVLLGMTTDQSLQQATYNAAANELIMAMPSAGNIDPNLFVQTIAGFAGNAANQSVATNTLGMTQTQIDLMNAVVAAAKPLVSSINSSNTTAASAAQTPDTSAADDYATLVKSGVDGLKSLTDASKNISIEMMKATGNIDGAAAAQRDLTIANMKGTAEQIIKQTEQLDANAIAQKTLDIQLEKNKLQDQLNGLTDTSVEALKRQRDALDKSNQGIFDQIQAQTALNSVNAALKGITDQSMGMQVERALAGGDTAGAAKLQREIDTKVFTDAAATASARLLAGGLTEVEIATQNEIIAQSKLAIVTYDGSEAYKEATKSLAAFTNAMDGLKTESRNLDIELARASGGSGIAEAAGMVLQDTIAAAIKGVSDPVEIATLTETVKANATKQAELDLMTQRTGLQDELNNLTDTNAQALKRQRDALIQSTESLNLFDKVQAAKAYNSVRDAFKQPLSLTQAASDVSVAGFNVAGLDSDGIATYVNKLLSDPAMWETGFNGVKQLSAVGRATALNLDNVTEALKTLGQAADKVRDERLSLEGTLLQKLGLTAELRKRELATIDASNRPLQELIYGLEDLDKALEDAIKAATKASEARIAAIVAERDALQNDITSTQGLVQRSAAAATEAVNKAEKDRIAALQKQSDATAELSQKTQDNINALDGLVNSLKSASDTLRDIPALAEITYTQAALRFDQMLAGARIGGIPDQKELDSVLGTLTSRNDNTYSSAFDMTRDRLITANKADEMAALLGAQKSAEELMLEAQKNTVDGIAAQIKLIQEDAQTQREAIDNQVKEAQAIFDKLSGVDTSIVTMDEAMRAVAVLDGKWQGDTLKNFEEQIKFEQKWLTQEITRLNEIRTEAYNTTAAVWANVSATGGVANATAVVASAISALAGALTAPATTSVPGFASGGYHTGGLRIVGERGREIEATGPARIFNAEQTRAMLGGGGDTKQLEKLIERLTQEVAALKQSGRETAAATKKMANQFDSATNGGDAMFTTAV